MLLFQITTGTELFIPLPIAKGDNWNYSLASTSTRRCSWNMTQEAAPDTGLEAQVAALEEMLQKSPQKKIDQIRAGHLEAQVAAHTSDCSKAVLVTATGCVLTAPLTDCITNCTTHCTTHCTINCTAHCTTGCTTHCCKLRWQHSRKK